MYEPIFRSFRHAWPALTIVISMLLAGCGGHGPKADPNAHKLTDADVKIILDQAEAAASSQPSLLRVNATLGFGRMHIRLGSSGGAVAQENQRARPVGVVVVARVLTVVGDQLEHASATQVCDQQLWWIR